MKLKVIKEIKGLVPGDELVYNEKNDQYEIFKVEEDISDSGVTKKSIKVTIGSWLVEDFKDYLVYVDDDGNQIVVNNINYSDSPDYKKDEAPIAVAEKSEVDTLKEKVQELEKELDEYKKVPGVNPQTFYVRIPDHWSYPYRYYWNY